MGRDDTAYRKVIRARTALVMDHPFFGHLALQMKLVEDRECDTAWSDGKTLAYNPHYAGMLPHEKLTGLMGHVVMHPACRHHLRRKGRDPRHWNIACDYAINWILLDAGLTLPDGYLDDPAMRGRTADDIYARLYEDSSGGDPDVREGRPEGGASADDPKAAPPDAGGRPGMQARQAEEGDRRPPSPEGAAVDAASADEDETRFDHCDPGRSGEVRDAPPPEDGAAETGDGETDESEWRIHLAQAASRARTMGDLPAGLARLVDTTLCPRLDWRRLLSRFIQASARCDYAWMPPNRRYLHQGLYLPSMRSDDLPEMVVAVDTSGSISPRELEQFGAELSGILETCAMTVHLLYCDARVAKAETLHRYDLPISLSGSGGGGTDFRPAFDWVAEQGLCPVCMVYLTDLACSRFPPAPSYPVLWAVVGEGAGAAPPFGESIQVN